MRSPPPRAPPPKETPPAARPGNPGEPSPRIEYTELEQNVWRTVCRELPPKWDQYAINEFRDGVAALELPRNRVPELDEVWARLEPITGFRYLPAAGLVPLREFYGSLEHRR